MMTTFAMNPFPPYQPQTYYNDPMNRHTAYTESQYSQGSLFPPTNHQSYQSMRSPRQSHSPRDIEPRTTWTEPPRPRARSRQDYNLSQSRTEAVLSRAVSKAYASNPGDTTPRLPMSTRSRRPSASGRALKALSCNSTEKRDSITGPSVPRARNLAAKVLAPTNIHGSHLPIEALPPMQPLPRNDGRHFKPREVQSKPQLPTLANSNLARLNVFPAPPPPIEDHPAYVLAPHITTQISNPRVPPPTKNPTPNNRSTTNFVPPPIVRRPPRPQPQKVHSTPTSPLIWLEDDKMWLNTGDVASNDRKSTSKGRRRRDSSETRASSAPPRERQDSVDLRMSATFSPGDDIGLGRRISRITVLSVDSAIPSRDSPSQEERDRRAKTKSQEIPYRKDRRGSVSPVRAQFISLMAATAQFSGAVDSLRISRRDITTTHNSYMSTAEPDPPLSSSALPPAPAISDKQRQIPLLQEALLGIDLNIPSNPFSSFRIPRKPLTSMSPRSDDFDRSRISHFGVPLAHFTTREAIDLPARAKTTGHAAFEFSDEELEDERRRLGLQAQGQGQVSPVSPTSSQSQKERERGQISVFSPVSSMDMDSLSMTFKSRDNGPRATVDFSSPSDEYLRFNEVSPMLSARNPLATPLSEYGLDKDWSTVSPTSSAQPSFQLPLSILPLNVTSRNGNATVASLWDTLGLTSPTKNVDPTSSIVGQGGGDVSTFTSLSSQGNVKTMDKESQTSMSARDGRIVLLRHGGLKEEDEERDAGNADADPWSGDVKWILAGRARGLDAQGRRKRSS